VTHPYAVELLAEFRVAELRRKESVARLAAIASCCRPSTWALAVRRAADAAARRRRGTRRGVVAPTD
jgi:hypothetical protein